MMTDEQFTEIVGATPQQVAVSIDKAIEKGLIEYIWKNKPNLVDAVTPLIQAGAGMRVINSIITQAEHNTGKKMDAMVKLALRVYCKSLIKEVRRGKRQRKSSPTH